MSAEVFLKRVIILVISLFFFVFIKPILYIIRLLKKDRSPFCIILFYHSVFEHETRRFKKQLRLLSLFTEPVSIDVIDKLAKRKRHVVVTFDDAFQNVIKNAAPELERRKIPFAIFVPAGQIGKEPGWLANTGRKNEHEKIASLGELLGLPADLVTLGSHTVNHRKLSQLNEELAYQEIRKSKDILEASLKREIKYIAIPHGEHRQDIIDHCRRAGYRQVFTIKYESPFVQPNTYGRGRNEAEPSDWPIEFVLNILGAGDWLRAYSFLKNKLQRLFSKSSLH
jgi:peptidoglycan/xylan/chitin deacetylase (PgdA/CDA1 family)